MPPRHVYLLDQAEKCRWHASKIADAETQAELLKLAAEYIERATEIERRRGHRERLDPEMLGPQETRPRLTAYQEKIAPTDPAPISEPADVLLFERSTESLEQENVWLKEKLARIKGAKPLQ